MKTIFKILVIVIVAVLVGSLFYGAVTTISSGTNQSSISERPAPADSEFIQRDRENDGGLQFPADAVKNLAIISIVSVIYLNVPKWLGRRRSILKVVSW